MQRKGKQSAKKTHQTSKKTHQTSKKTHHHQCSKKIIKKAHDEVLNNGFCDDTDSKSRNYNEATTTEDDNDDEIQIIG